MGGGCSTLPGLGFQPSAWDSSSVMADLSKDLSALRIPQTERAGSKRGASVLIGIVAAVLLAGGGFWFWSARLQAAPVKVAPVTAANAGGKSGAGRGPQRFGIRDGAPPGDSLVEGDRQGRGRADRGRPCGQGGSDSGPSRRHAGARVADRSPRRSSPPRRRARPRIEARLVQAELTLQPARAAAERKRRRQGGAGPGAIGRRFVQGAHRVRAAAGQRVARVR